MAAARGAPSSRPATAGTSGWRSPCSAFEDAGRRSTDSQIELARLKAPTTHYFKPVDLNLLEINYTT